MIASTLEVRYMTVPERQAIIELLATAIESNADVATEKGDDALGIILRSVRSAMSSAAGELAVRYHPNRERGPACARPADCVSVPSCTIPGRGGPPLIGLSGKIE